MNPLVIGAAVLAGAVGAVARYAISRAVARRPFPWAVLIANVAGSGIAGVVLGVAYVAADPVLQLIMLGGFAGGLTTFSTFAVESMQLAHARRLRELIASSVANFVGSLIALGLAWLITVVVLGGF